MAASADGSNIVATTTDISGAQNVAIYNAASNKWLTNLAIENFGGNAALSANGTVIESGSTLLNSNASVLGSLAWQDVFQSPGPSSSLPLEKIPDGGSLLYMARASASTAVPVITRPSCVDIFDVNHGTLLQRLNLTEEIQAVTDAMAIDAFGQNIYLITNAGLTICKSMLRLCLLAASHQCQASLARRSPSPAVASSLPQQLSSVELLGVQLS